MFVGILENLYEEALKLPLSKDKPLGVSVNGFLSLYVSIPLQENVSELFAIF